MPIKFSLLLLLFSVNAFADSLDCPCQVVKVTDGDTVHVLDQSRIRHIIRLMDIDTPEKKQPFNKKAGQNLAGYVAGENVEVEHNNKYHFDRLIGKLLKDGRDINLQQVKDGYAWHYKKYQKEQTSIDRILYSSAEIDARKKRIGLWSVPAVAPCDYRRAKRKK